MSGVLFLLSLIAAGWLGLWVVRSPGSAASRWWPFDYPDDTSGPPQEAVAPPGQRRHPSPASRPARWQPGTAAQQRRGAGRRPLR